VLRECFESAVLLTALPMRATTRRPWLFTGGSASSRSRRADTVDLRITEVHELLELHEYDERSSRPTIGFTSVQLRSLTAIVDAPTEPLSRVGEKVVGSS
jgi:hypothetical protein